MGIFRESKKTGERVIRPRGGSKKVDIKKLHEELEGSSLLEALGKNHIPVGGMVQLQAREPLLVEFHSQRRVEAVEEVELDEEILVVELVPEISEESNEGQSWRLVYISRALDLGLEFEKENY